MREKWDLQLKEKEEEKKGFYLDVFEPLIGQIYYDKWRKRIKFDKQKDKFMWKG